MLVIKFESIEQVIFLKRRITCGKTELFKVSKVLEIKPVTYHLRDTKDDEILGGFYECELQKVKTSEINQIEMTIISQTRKGMRQLLVLWVGYKSEFDSWIAAKGVHNA